MEVTDDVKGALRKPSARLGDQPGEAAQTLSGRRRRLLFRLRRAGRVLERGERLQELTYGALLAAFVLAMPNSTPLGPDELVRRLAGEPVVTYGALYPLARAIVGALDAAPADVLRTLAALAYGMAFTATLAMLRRLGFRRTACLPAALIAFGSPIAWRGASSPCDYAPGIFGASALLWSLLRVREHVPRDYQWRAMLLLGIGTMLRPELVLVLPAAAWAVRRHPARPQEAHLASFSVYVVVLISIAIGLRGPDEDARLSHFIHRVLAGADPSLRAFVDWPVWLVMSFGVGLVGLYALLFARRDPKLQRAPRWLVPWCLAALAPMVVGHPSAGPIGAFLVPAIALGLADGANRLGSRRAEVQAGLALLGVQVLFNLLAAWSAAR